jgi:glycosyltransferase involved in cell wall biosynthesis
VNSVVPFFVQGRSSGIGRTTRELVKALDALDSIPFDIHLYAQNMRGIGAASLKTRFRAHQLYLPNRLWMNRVIQHVPVREILYRYDLVHCPSNYGEYYDTSRVLLTIHDALFFAYPDSFLGHDEARVLYPPLAKSCRSIITCSDSSKSDIVHYMGVEPEKVTVAYWGVDHEIFYREEPDESKVALSYLGLHQPYYLMVSCDVGRKNTEALMHAFRRYRSTPGADHQLVLVWWNPPTNLLSEFRKEIEDSQIVFLSNMSDDQLRSLYNGATASFFPSRYEGFGLPVLESMACGTPVVTCRNSSLAEVGGEAALYTSPDDIDEMASYMHEFESETIDREAISVRGLRQAATFRWERAARQYVDFYSKAFAL